MTLFDPALYGAETIRSQRVRKQRPDEIRLQRPWVLLRHAKGPAQAHLVTDVVRPNSTRDATAARNGALRTLCGKYGQAIAVDGHPMALLCHGCWDLSPHAGD